ncbi:MAG TPA: class I SAM-dependent methyltransferase, partial [Vicinamibacteria bacterium]|nr:class I SAM-dependent methyltransferase [Vicinamibacteria bacterium]
MTEFAYVGTELELFAHAANWKAYWAQRLRPYLGRRVLDVGAGLGATARLLASSSQRWTCLEPDASLARQLVEAVARGELPPQCEVVQAFVRDLPGAAGYHTVLYVDVLEHIADDRAELEQAAHQLAPGGHLVVLAPAHGFLYSRFDAAIGHLRRYDKRTLRAISPPGCTLASLAYLDAAGLLLSLANAYLLRRDMPTLANIRFWDRLVVPVSRRIDPLL